MVDAGKSPGAGVPATQLYGLPALIEELASQGIAEDQLLEAASLADPGERLDVHERTALFRAAHALAVKPETALLAGLRQKISHFGVYGFALSTSATMADAFKVYRQFFGLSGAVLQISLHVQGDVGILRSHQPQSLGPVLPFVAEYWRSSQTRLLSAVLGQPFPSRHMYFPYPPPAYAHLYSRILNSPVTFGSDVMEWHFDADVLSTPCKLADPDTARLTESYCQQMIDRGGRTTGFQREILRACIFNLSIGVNAAMVAGILNMSVRTFYRRLRAEGVTFQSLLDRIACSVAVEYLQNTSFPVEEIGARCGYQDASNFRKAFRRWTGRTPTSFRNG